MVGEEKGNERRQMFDFYQTLSSLLQVPVGVSITVDEKGSKKTLANLDKIGDQVLIAQGGNGGGPSNG